MIRSGVCPESGRLIGSEHGVDPYKHAVHTFHLPDQGVKRVRELFANPRTERGRRIAATLDMAESGDAAVSEGGL